MRDKLNDYIQLLFAGTTDTDDIREEILQNTLDKYDDLVEQGKSPEAAYRLSISGIGDIGEILGDTPCREDGPGEPEAVSQPRDKLLRSVAIALYILCPVPLFLTGSELGLCGLLLMVAVATAIMAYVGRSKGAVAAPKEDAERGHTAVRKVARRIVWLVALAVYIALSIISGAWYITWMIFAIAPCCTGLIDAILDLKEAVKG